MWSIAKKHIILSLGVFLMALSVLTSANGAPACESVFNGAPTKSNSFAFARTFAHEIQWFDWHLERKQTRLSAPDHVGGAWFMNEAKFSTEVDHGENSSAAYYLSYTGPLNHRQGPLNTQHAPTSSMGLRQFRKVKVMALDFVINTYRDRRPHWAPEFFFKLKKLADEYEKESAYLTTEGKDWNDPSRPRGASGEYLLNGQIPQDLLGTMRLIHEREGRLPMENYFGIDLVVPGKRLKVEPGNFAMAKDANEIATIELSIQILAHIERYKTEFGKEPWFATYADQYSEKLYGSLGFQYIPAELIKQRNPDAVFEIDPHGVVRLSKHDVQWAPMYATQEMMTSILLGKLQRLADKNESTSQQQIKDLYIKFVAAVEQGRRAMANHSTVFKGAVTNSTMTRQQLHAQLFVRQTDNLESRRLYLQLSHEWHKRARADIEVPYPIPEGYSMKNELGFKIEYSRGLLKMTWMEADHSGKGTLFESQEIWIDPKLTTPSQARITQRYNGNFEEALEIKF